MRPSGTSFESCYRKDVAMRCLRNGFHACWIGAALLTAQVTTAKAAGKIYYGSRVGMTVSVVSVEGLDSERAIIRTQHSREDAIGFCRDYVREVTEECIKAELEIPMNDVITANCKTGVFTDFFGNRYQFKGKNLEPDPMAAYTVIDLRTGEIADGSSASGYPTNMGIFQSLCPGTAPFEGDW